MNSYVGAAIAALIYAHLGFFIAAKWRRNDLADVLWGPGFLFVAVGAYWVNRPELGWREILLLGGVGLWGLRLASHIGRRFWKSETEDARYAGWRKDWGSRWLIFTYAQVFLLQSTLLFVIDLPLIHSLHEAPGALSVWVVLGAMIWIFGFVFEALADEQLRRFKSRAENRGRLMTEGLWSWSRHPNYFGEVLQWWGIFGVAFTPSGWWLVVSPLVLTFLILKVSGVSMLEDLMRNRPGFEEYRRRTARFIPRRPR